MSPEDPDPATAPAATLAAAPDLLVPAELMAPEESPGAEVPMCLDLLVSAFASTSEKAMPFLVMPTMFRVILSGVLPFNGMNGLSQLSWIAPARWGFAAPASTVNLNGIGLLPGTTRTRCGRPRQATGCGTSASRPAGRSSTCSSP
jgi:hypothetical protein